MPCTIPLAKRHPKLISKEELAYFGCGNHLDLLETIAKVGERFSLQLVSLSGPARVFIKTAFILILQNNKDPMHALIGRTSSSLTE